MDSIYFDAALNKFPLTADGKPYLLSEAEFRKKCCACQYCEDCTTPEEVLVGLNGWTDFACEDCEELDSGDSDWVLQRMAGFPCAWHAEFEIGDFCEHTGCKLFISVVVEEDLVTASVSLEGRNVDEDWVTMASGQYQSAMLDTPIDCKFADLELTRFNSGGLVCTVPDTPIRRY